MKYDNFWENMLRKPDHGPFSIKGVSFYKNNCGTAPLIECNRLVASHRSDEVLTIEMSAFNSLR